MKAQTPFAWCQMCGEYIGGTIAQPLLCPEGHGAMVQMQPGDWFASIGRRPRARSTKRARIYQRKAVRYA